MDDLIAQIRGRLEAVVGGEKRFASSFSSRTFRDLDKRAAGELDGGAQSAFDAITKAEEALEREGLAQYAPFDREAFIARFIRKWGAYQAAGARTLNWMVTGPARFPVDRNRKAMDREHRLLGEYLEFLKGTPGHAVKHAKIAKGRALGADGLAGAEIEDLRDRLQKRELAQRQMKSVNEIIRREKLKEGDGAKLSELITARGFPMNPNLAGMLLRPDYGRAGYATYQLQNNLAEIKRLQGRIADVERRLADMQAAGDAAPAEREVNGVRIVEDMGENRIRLIFDGKPPAPVIAALKGRGFRWAPSQGAWQRQLTNAARAAAEGIVEQVA